MNDLNAMEVDEKTDPKIVPLYPELKEEEKIPAILTKMLNMKGININDHKVIRVGGGGTCVANSISLFATGAENMYEDIAQNKNKPIVNHWNQIYKESFEFPLTERVGN